MLFFYFGLIVALITNGLMKWQGTSGGMAAGQILPEKQFPTEEHGSRGFRDVC